MKSSHLLILLIIGIIILHALDDRKGRKTEKAGKKAELVKKSPTKPGIDPTMISKF